MATGKRPVSMAAVEWRGTMSDDVSGGDPPPTSPAIDRAVMAAERRFRGPSRSACAINITERPANGPPSCRGSGDLRCHRQRHSAALTDVALGRCSGSVRNWPIFPEVPFGKIMGSEVMLWAYRLRQMRVKWTGGPKMKLSLVVALFFLVVLSDHQGLADSDSLTPVTFKTILADLKRTLVTQSLKDPVTLANCLEGSPQKRKVCTYKLGSYMSLMASTEKGGSDIVGLTLICAPANDLDSAKCLVTYGAVMALTAPDIADKVRGKILGLLIESLEVANSASIVTDERKFIMQKSAGIWFHIYASGSPESD